MARPALDQSPMAIAVRMKGRPQGRDLIERRMAPVQFLSAASRALLERRDGRWAIRSNMLVDLPDRRTLQRALRDVRASAGECSGRLGRNRDVGMSGRLLEVKRRFHSDPWDGRPMNSRDGPAKMNIQKTRNEQ